MIEKLIRPFLAAALWMICWAPAAAHEPPTTAASAGAPAGLEETDPGLLTNARQLIFEGKRSGEGYFSRDGRELVFQSERESDNPFYQIYVLDLETGDVERISPGYGKTTCAWIHPDGKRVLFASTHDDPEARDKQKAELADRASGKQKRYAWDYDPNFDLYAYDRATKQYTRLTSERGYDAEASYSPDGKRIAFASNRAAYTEPLSDEARERLSHDPSYFIDLYIMNADGTDVRRLAGGPGYDGGPFFSPDGKRVCWRRFSEDGATAEVFTANIDGTDVRQLTQMGAMSWAPYFHPSGEYLIFTTNRHGFANFELYIVSAAGGPPVRVTVADKFDGLPVFSPDGKKLAWTCSRTSDGAAQIFIADWDHERAKTLLAEAAKRSEAAATGSISAGGAGAGTDAAPDLPPSPQTSTDISPADIRAYVEALAGDAFEGRMTGTPGELGATAYVAREFARLGLEPAGDNGTFFQAFEFTAGVALAPGNALSLEPETSEAGGPTRSTQDYAVDQDWRPLAFSALGAVQPAEIVFAGYGLVVPKGENVEAYDSYAGLDVAGKWALVLTGNPDRPTPEERAYFARFGGTRYKAMLARDRGAAGIIFVNGAEGATPLMKLEFDAAIARTSVPAVCVTREVADGWLRRAGTSVAAQSEAADKGQETLRDALPGVKLRANIALKNETRRGRNVLARLRAKDASLNAPALIVGGHVDHLGRGHSSNSLARSEEREGIHCGADDNASGVAAMLEAAEWLVELQRKGKLPLQRDVIFAAWSGEELGLIGSKHFVDAIAAQQASADNIRGRVAAYLNMDMVGRLEKSLLLAGVGSSGIWRKEIEQRNAGVGLPIVLQEDGYLPTDATSFYLKGVPILSAFTGVHSDYHTPRDTADKLNYEGAAKVARFIALTARSIATNPSPPDFIAPTKPDPRAPGGGTRATLRAYLGTIPDYAPAEVPGLKLNGVATGGPAHAAGVRGGDIIVELGGRKVENIYDYTYALEGLRVGEKTTIVVLRDGQRLTLDMTPGSRE
jgi:Tol biopolymer transport system component